MFPRDGLGGFPRGTIPRVPSCRHLVHIDDSAFAFVWGWALELFWLFVFGCGGDCLGALVGPGTLTRGGLEPSRTLSVPLRSLAPRRG